jgi:splicing factor 3B subunit 3
MFFYILQNELGDLFKLTFNYTKKEVHSVTMIYFDTIPVSVGICILKKGYIFAPAEKGNHMLYRIKGLAENEKI